MIVARLALALAVLALALPAVALAQSDPFGPLPPAPQPQQQVQTTSSTTSADDGGGLAGWQQALIFTGAGILLAVIGLAIVTDARRNAPVEERETATRSKAAREADRHRRKQLARQKGKTARAARRRNR